MAYSPYYDARETMAREERDAELFERLPHVLEAASRAPGYAERLKGFDLWTVDNPQALAALPVLRKADLPALHRETPPFGGLVPGEPDAFSRLFASPGPIFEAEEAGDDPWGMARALYACGVRAGDVTLNTFSYHLTPGGFIFDSAARALRCPVIPAGPGNTEHQLQVMAAFRPAVYLGVPDFLKVLLDAWRAARPAEPFPIRRAVVSGAAFPPALQEEFSRIGLDAYQVYATADIGCIAYETPSRQGMVVNEGLIVEIVRPGTGDPAPEGEVGEVVVTALSLQRPVIRLALGDLSAFLPGGSPGGRTNRRLRGWLGRADQTTKIKGMFVRPEQVAEIGRRHPALGRLRLVVTRVGEADAMTLYAEADGLDAAEMKQVRHTFLAVTKLRGAVELVAMGSLPNDGKVIADERG